MQRSSKSVSINVECLEQRELLAGNILATTAGFTINGDNLLADVVRVTMLNDGVTVHVELGHRSNVQLGTGQTVWDRTDNKPLSAVSEIRFFGNGGNDYFLNDTSVRSVAFGQAGIDDLIGGSGRDLLNGGSESDEVYGRGGHDILVGGSGNDVLGGGDGRDLLIGGLGADSLYGGTNHDILIGGTTDHDLNETALQAIQSEWRRGISYQDRIAHLTGAAAGGFNGTTLLRFTQQSTDTVHDDGVVDRLSGEYGRDWLFSVDIQNELRDRQDGERNN